MPKAKPKPKAKKKAKPKGHTWLTRDVRESDLPEIYKLLSEKFPENAIVKGKLWYGLETEGPKGQSVINRLNEVLGINHWHYEYNVEDEKRGNMWAVTCGITLMMGNWKFLGQEEIKTRSEGDPVFRNTNNVQSVFVPLAVRSWIGGVSHLSRSEAKKGAITNTLKKCAAAFGVGKEVYERLSEPEFEKEFEKQEEDAITVEESTGTKEIEMKPVNEHPLEVEKKGDVYAQLLTELNSVQDKETLAKAQEMMDRVKGQLTATQLAEAIRIFANLKKKFT